MDSGAAVTDSARSQLQRLLQSESFRNTQSLRVLLAYLAEKSLSGESLDLKEYTVGVEAFGKPSDYNPQLDASVRVQTGKLRQKIEEYYRTEGIDDPIIIEFPKGHFDLKFVPRPAAASLYSGLAGTQLRRWRRFALLLLGVLVFLLPLAAHWRAALWRQQNESTWIKEHWTPELELIWQPYLESNHPLVLSLGTPLFVKYSRFYFRFPEINEWKEAERSPYLRLLEKTLKEAAPLPSQIYTGIGEANGAFLLCRLLAGRKHELVLKRSSVLDWEDIKNNDTIFLGSPKSNTHLKSLPLEQDFVIEDGAIHNRRPRPGESAVYGSVAASGSPSPEEDHALIIRSPGLNGHGEITVLAGNSTQGTWAAVEYVTQQEHARELIKAVRLPSGKMPRSYQLVIRAKFKTEVPVQISYVTHHVLQQ